MEPENVVTEEVEKVPAESATAEPEVHEEHTEELTPEQLAEKEAEAAAAAVPKEGEQPPVVPPAKKKPTLVDQLVKTRSRAQTAEQDLLIAKAKLEVYEKLGVKPPEAISGKPDTTAKDLAAEYERLHPKPTIDDYDDVIELQIASADWADERRNFIREESKKRTVETEQQSVIRQDREVIGQNIEGQKLRGVEKYEDFEELVINNDDFKLSPVMNDVLAFAENGEDGAIFLAKNPKELERIRSIKNPVQQGIEMLRLVDGIKAGTIQVVKKSAAPPPPSNLSGRVPATDKGPPEDIHKLKEWLGDTVE